jgi:branched-chain amino acid transport system permease protein
VAGGYFVAYSLVAAPANFGFHHSIFVMMYVFVGGLAHSLTGPIVGAFVLTFTPEYFRVAKEYESIITAIVMIFIIIFMPMGILGLYDGRIRNRLARIKWFRRESRSEPEVSL